MLKAYRRWNIFERAYFWHNSIAIAVLMVGSFIISLLTFVETPYKLGVITFLIIAYAWYKNHIWNIFESLESKWKGEQ